jgi:2-oxoisovalerate dehydrogenase E1 component beta subunit
VIVTYLQAISQALREEMRRDEDVILLGEDIGRAGGAFKVTEGLHDEFGERVIDTPISELLIVGAGIGAAILGMRAVVEMQFMDFVSCGFDQVVNMAATFRYRHGGAVKVPLVVRGPCGAGVHGGLFHSQNSEAWFTHVPGLKVVAPATAYDAKGLLKAAIRDDDPVVYFEHKRLYRSLKEDLPEDDYVVPIGKALLRRDGRDLTFITYGASVHTCLAAADELQKSDGLECRVLDLRTLLPLDREAILEHASATGKVVIVHEARLTGGLGGEIAALIAEEAFDALDGPIVRVATRDAHYAFSPPLEEFLLPGVPRVVEKARELAGY